MASPLVGMVNLGGRMARATVVALALASTMPCALAAPDPAIGEAKKVGTERITVTPPSPAAPLPSDGGPPIPHGAPPAGTPATLPRPTLPPAEVHKGVEGLPPGVAKMRQRLLDAAYSGDLQRLKIVVQSNETPPIFSVNEVRDPIEYLKNQSGDGQGLELLAILTDLLESSWARVNAGKPQEMYVWPAYAALPLDKLEPGQLVELYKIVTSSDLEEMKSAGRYTFYTVGIGPDGTWHWFKPAD